MDPIDYQQMDRNAETQANEERILRDPPKGVVQVSNPHTAVVLAQRRELSRAYYEKRAQQDQLADELGEVSQQLMQLGGLVGTYSDYADQIHALTPDMRARELKRRTDAIVSLVRLVPVALIGIALLAGITVAVLLLVLFA